MKCYYKGIKLFNKSLKKGPTSYRLYAINFSKYLVGQPDGKKIGPLLLLSVPVSLFRSVYKVTHFDRHFPTHKRTTHIHLSNIRAPLVKLIALIERIPLIGSLIGGIAQLLLSLREHHFYVSMS